MGARTCHGPARSGAGCSASLATCSWRLGGAYLVIEQSPALTVSDHDRLRPGMNHLAFHAGSRASVDALTTAGSAHGWTLLFPDRHPHAGGPDHYAAYLTSTDGFEVELVADENMIN